MTTRHVISKIGGVTTWSNARAKRLGGKVGINPKLHALASASGSGDSSDFFDVTTGNNQLDPSVPGYSATTGWDPVTGLGTPNAANLVPALAS